MKKITFFILFLLFSISSNAQEFQWVKQIAGTTATPFSVKINDLVYDRDEKIVVCGSFSGTVDFDPTSAINNRTANGTDGFVAYYNGGGELLWIHTTNEIGNEEFSAGIINYGSAYTRRFTGVVVKGGNLFYLRALNLNDGTLFTDTPTYICTGTVKINDIDRFSSASGRYFITGGFTGTLSIGSYFRTSEGLSDVFVASFETSGEATNQMFNVIYANNYGGTGNDEGLKLYADTFNTRLVGYYSNTIDFNLSSPNTITRVSNGGTDAFLADLQATGYPSSLGATLSIGGTGDDAATSVMVRGSQTVIGGRFRGTVNFNPSGTANNITATGGSDGFIASYNGTSHFAIKRGGILDDEVKALTFASAGANIYYVSKLGGTTTSSNAINAIEVTGAKISTIGATFAPTNGSTLNEPTALVQISGTNLYTTGIFNTNTNFNPAGTANLSFISGGNNSFIHKMSACTTSAQTPTITGSPSSMCVGDSRVIYVNTISTPSPRLLNSNNEWVWYSGTCGTGTVVGRGESITINPTVNTTYYVRGEGGCVANGACSSAYSVLVFPYPNANVTQSGNTLTSSQATGTYQWLDCNNGNANIAGATNQSYTPTVSGSYAVRVTNSGCTVTSACINITVLSADDFSKLGVKLYPNPVTNSFTIEGEVVVENVIIYNLLGQELKTFSNTNSFNVEDLQSGTYLVQVTTERGTAQTKIIKN